MANLFRDESIGNLNFARIRTDGQESLSLTDPGQSQGSGKAFVCAFFRDLASALIRQIDEADVIVGCVAWLTDLDVLSALSERDGVSIIVQKEDFLRPDEGDSNGWPARLRRAYESLRGLSRWDFGGMISSMNTAGDDSMEAIRCMGNVKRERTRPNMHHKFLVFCRWKQLPDGDGSGLDRIVEPYAVWTGSYNLTRNSAHSLENAVFIEDEKIASAYYAEWDQVACLSEPLDWSSEYIEPEWRMGT